MRYGRCYKCSNLIRKPVTVMVPAVGVMLFCGEGCRFEWFQRWGVRS